MDWVWVVIYGGEDVWMGMSGAVEETTDYGTKMKKRYGNKQDDVGGGLSFPVRGAGVGVGGRQALSL